MYAAVTLRLKLKNAQLISQSCIVPFWKFIIAKALHSWQGKAGSKATNVWL
jgi:hypothetical protein